ncbi:carbonic anhydrase-like [Diadema antillarum]|uniref:carbonic anhydrase-like n=1 Tax=Diadema antillarum TaxID=105358 RepID=UPI003A8A1BFB
MATHHAYRVSIYAKAGAVVTAPQPHQGGEPPWPYSEDGSELEQIDPIGNWSYDGVNGTREEFWPDIYNSQCGGNAQSPIDIDPDSATPTELAPFDFTSYDIIKSGTLENNGHALEVDLSRDPDEGSYDVTGGGLEGTYRVYQFHFHFGSDNQKGSEHAVNGTHYPVEMHLVHYDTQYPGLKEAANYPGGVAVVGVFFQVGQHNHGLDPLLDHIEEVENPFTHIEIDDIQLSALLPGSTERFWRYDGSLTTPLCNEGIIWTLLQDFAELSQDQLDLLRSLVSDATDENGVELLMTDNFRQLQPLNERTVYDVETDEFTSTPDPGRAPTTKALVMPVISALILTFLILRV